MATRKKKAAKEVRAITAADLVTKPRQAFEIPGLLPDGATGIVYIKQLSAKDGLSFRERFVNGQTEEVIAERSAQYLPWLISRTVVDEAGSPILTEEAAGDLTHAALTALAPKVLEMNRPAVDQGSEGKG
jgi:hypothetical protein